MFGCDCQVSMTWKGPISLASSSSVYDTANKKAKDLKREGPRDAFLCVVGWTSLYCGCVCHHQCCANIVIAPEVDCKLSRAFFRSWMGWLWSSCDFYFWGGLTLWLRFTCKNSPCLPVNSLMALLINPAANLAKEHLFMSKPGSQQVDWNTLESVSHACLPGAGELLYWHCWDLHKANWFLTLFCPPNPLLYTLNGFAIRSLFIKFDDCVSGNERMAIRPRPSLCTLNQSAQSQRTAELFLSGDKEILIRLTGKSWFSPWASLEKNTWFLVIIMGRLLWRN